MRQKRFITVFFIMLMLSSFSVTIYTPPLAAASDTKKSTNKINQQLLIGRWVRPDGGYVLELKEIGKDGSIKASYFNPKPINVAQAEWKLRDGRLTIFVELRDVNYPGSKYNLYYDSKTDRLKGTYFQAVYGETYDVEFMRAK